MQDCRYHTDHESRISRLESDMKELISRQIHPGLWLGLFSFFGVCFSTIGSIVGVILSAYLK